MEYKQKTIYCPRCGRKVATWDGRSSMPVIGRCKKCNKRVVYYVDNDETEIKDIPERNVLPESRICRGARWRIREEK